MRPLQLQSSLKRFGENRHAVGRAELLRQGYSALGAYLERVRVYLKTATVISVANLKATVRCSQLKTVDSLLKYCTLCKFESRYQGAAFPELNLNVFLCRKKSIKAVVKFLASLLYLRN